MQDSDIEPDWAEIGLGDTMPEAIYLTLLQASIRSQK